MTIPGGWELLLVVAVIMVLFGYKKLPDATRSLGQSMRIFKAEAKGLRDTDEPAPAGRSTTAAAVAPPPYPAGATGTSAPQAPQTGAQSPHPPA